MKALNEDKSISVAANTDRRFLPNLQHALGDLADSVRPECGPSFHRDIDFGDWKVLALEHGPYLFGRDPDDQHTEKCWRHEDAPSRIRFRSRTDIPYSPLRDPTSLGPFWKIADRFAINGAVRKPDGSKSAASLSTAATSFR